MRIALAGLAALAVAMGIGRFAFTPMLPMMQADSGLSLIAGGWLASANYLGYLFGALSAGFFRRSGRVIRLGLLLIAGTTLAMGITHQTAVWAALRLAAGMASAWVVVLAAPHGAQDAGRGDVRRRWSRHRRRGRALRNVDGMERSFERGLDRPRR